MSLIKTIGIKLTLHHAGEVLHVPEALALQTQHLVALCPHHFHAESGCSCLRHLHLPFLPGAPFTLGMWTQLSLFTSGQKHPSREQPPRPPNPIQHPTHTSYPSPNWIPLPLTNDLPLSPLPLSFCITLSAAPRLMLGTQQGLSEQLPDGGMNGSEDATKFLIHNLVNAGSPCPLPPDCILLGQLLSSASAEDNTFHQIRPTAPIPPPCDSDPKSIRTSYKIIWQPDTYQNGPKVLLGWCIYPNSEIRIIVLSSWQRLERTPGEVETISRAPFSCTDSVTIHCTPPKSGLWAQLWETMNLESVPGAGGFMESSMGERQDWTSFRQPLWASMLCPLKNHYWKQTHREWTYWLPSRKGGGKR